MADEEKPKTKIERLKEEWRKAGFELKELDLAPGEHIITFFGEAKPVPEDRAHDPRGDEDQEGAR
jgi:hypothetical protein